MPWSNNLTEYFRKNIEDFEESIKNNRLKNERVLVFFMNSSTTGTLFELTYEKDKNVRTTLKEYTNPAFTTANGIASILNDVKANASAIRYSMIIGCHGLGWIPVNTPSSRSASNKFHWDYTDGPQTRFFGGTKPEFQTDVTTLAEGISKAGMQMEYIMFDDCYMSCAEVAYDLKNVANYIIACPTEIMAYGFPYHIIGKYLVGNIDYAAICNGFYEFYKSYSTPCGTIGITKCSELNNLATIMKKINQEYTFDESLLSSIQILDGYSPTMFFDYGDYVKKLCTDATLLQEFNKQLERTVPYKKHTDYYYSSISGRQTLIKTYSGITISDPSINSQTVLKTETSWYKATH